MRELSIFVDEAGQQDMSEGHYLLMLVVHSQSVYVKSNAVPKAVPNSPKGRFCLMGVRVANRRAVKRYPSYCPLLTRLFIDLRYFS